MSLDAVAPDVFDQPPLWRIEAAAALGLTGEDLIAVMSPGPAFPAALRSLISSIPSCPRVIVDLGAGAGGASEWLRQSTAATVYAVEPMEGARTAATLAFPELHVIDGRADNAPLPRAVADAVVLSGVLSLMSDIGPVIEEVDRLLAGSGRVAIADLFSSGTATLTSEPNTFRSVDEVTKALAGYGFSVTGVGCGDAVPHASWADASQAVDDWIGVHCTDRVGYHEWSVDRQHLRDHVRAGNVIGGCIVAARALDILGDQ